jgi:hypothetical protein
MKPLSPGGRRDCVLFNMIIFYYAELAAVEGHEFAKTARGIDGVVRLRRALPNGRPNCCAGECAG